jgi:hypothetical protein
MAGGRPSTYNQEVADEICSRLSKGEPLSVICSDEHIPSFQTVYNWEKARPGFLEASTRARMIGTHYLAYDSLRVADDLTIDPAHKRVIVDTRLRLIGKWNARQYGDKIEHEHSGSIQTQTDDQLDGRIQALMATNAR